VVAVTKISCFLVPGVQMGLLQIKAVRNDNVAHMFVMNSGSTCPRGGGGGGGGGGVQRLTGGQYWHP
jgi:hypothetical protein